MFDGGRVIEPLRAKTTYSAAEFEAARAQGEAQGRAAASAEAASVQAAALDRIADAVTGALGALARVAHDHRAASAELALACARSVARSALESDSRKPPSPPPSRAWRGKSRRSRA